MNAFHSALAIAAGGFTGALLRFWISNAVKRFVPEAWTFTGTMTVNLIGCLLIGVVLTLYARERFFSPLTFQFIIVGVLGSLTTFSTFAAETLELLRMGRPGLAALHVGVNLVVGISLVWVGATIASNLLPANATAV
jgi:fluoride exporter